VPIIDTADSEWNERIWTTQRLISMKIKIQRPSPPSPPPPPSPPQLEPGATSATIFWKEMAAVMV